MVYLSGEVSQLSYRILLKRQIAPQGYLLRVHAPHVAQSAKPGQFVVVRLYEKGERIPLTLVRWSRKNGTIDLAFQVVGKTTYLLGEREAGDEISDVLGPLGKPSPLEHYGTVAFVAGGFGAAAILPIARALRRRGNRILISLGGRTRRHLIFRRELARTAHELLLYTDDGSAGEKGFALAGLERFARTEKIDLVYIIGPAIMMKFTAAKARELGLSAVASLNPIMVDGTGMCGSCRVEVAGRTYFACVDGPEFDAHAVNWDLLLKRLSMYREEEKLAFETVHSPARER